MLSFEQAVAAEANRRGLNGVICGHIHHAEIRDINGITYCNDGDWVESLTALVEHFDGSIELIHWPQHALQLTSSVEIPLAEGCLPISKPIVTNNIKNNAKVTA